jgi:hydroxymethylcytosylglucuronate/cytosylglucuronate synthase
MSRRLVCTAAAFGYGPAAKLLVIAKLLRQRSYSLCFVGYGTALEMAQSFAFDEVVECMPDDFEANIRSQADLWGADGILNVLEPAVGEVAKDLALPHFYIDSLFWMWTEPTPEVVDSEVYFIQQFPGVDARCLAWRSYVKNPIIVGPIVSVEGLGMKCEERTRLMVNFAGLESPFAKVDGGLRYPYTLTKLIYPILSRVALDYEEVIVAGNRVVMDRLRTDYADGPGNIKFMSLAHENFLELLASCRLLVSSPGLTTAYEGFSLNVPIRFLPPQNYSQSLMLDYYRKERLVDVSFHWADLGLGYEVRSGMREDLAVRKVLEVIDEFADNLDAQETSKGLLESIFIQPIDPLLGARQQSFVRSMGRQGGYAIVDAVDRWFLARDVMPLSLSPDETG